MIYEITVKPIYYDVQIHYFSNCFCTLRWCNCFAAVMRAIQNVLPNACIMWKVNLYKFHIRLYLHTNLVNPNQFSTRFFTCQHQRLWYQVDPSKLPDWVRSFPPTPAEFAAPIYLCVESQLFPVIPEIWTLDTKLGNINPSKVWNVDAGNRRHLCHQYFHNEGDGVFHTFDESIGREYKRSLTFMAVSLQMLASG